MLQWSVYGAAGVGFAARSVREHGEPWSLIPRVLAAFPAFHLGHGSGQAVGWLRALGACAGEAPGPHVPRRGRGQRADVYAVTPDAFREHLDAIERATGRAPGTDGRAARRRLDDHLRRRRRERARASGEELARRSWRGHFFIATDLIGRPGYLDWDGVRAVAGMGHVIGSHSCSHPDRMAACSWDQLMDEWTGSAAVLAEELGAPVTTRQRAGRALLARAWAARPRRPGYTTLFNSLPTQRLRLDRRLPPDRPVRDPRATPTAGEAAAAAAGRPLPWARQRAAWRLRGAAKTVAGPRYESVRRALLARR